MRIAILGSGVIGTTAAYYLARDGHEVTVIERQQEPALETSFANAGEVSPGYSAPWAGPGVPIKAIKWLLMRHSPLVIKPMLDAAMWRWGAAMLRNCTEARYRVNKARMVRLAEYSRDCMKSLRAERGIRYDERMQGTLQLFRTQKQFDGTGKDIEILNQHGVAFELLDREGYLRYEPALADVKHKFVGALRLPGDETGDCYKFTSELAKLAEGLGVKFRFGVHVRRLKGDRHGISAVETQQGPVIADRYLLALGSYSTEMLKPLGLAIPVYPVKGFSITVPVTDPSMSPESTIMDETHKVAVTRLGDRIRVGGTAQLSGFDLQLDEARRGTLEFVVTDLFPHGGDVARRVLDRPASDDARRPADPGADRRAQSLAGDRPRYVGLDDGRRNRTLARRLDVRSQSGHRHRGPDHRSLRQRRSRPRTSGVRQMTKKAMRRLLVRAATTLRRWERHEGRVLAHDPQAHVRPPTARRWGLSIALAICGCVTLGSLLPLSAQAQEIVVGQTLSLTGPSATIAQELLRGRRACIEFINAQGGIRGRRFKLVTRDDRNDAVRAVQLAREMVEQEDVAVMLGSMGPAVNASVLEWAGATGMAVVGPYGGDIEIRTHDSGTAFFLTANQSAEAARLASHIASLGLTRVVIVYASDKSGRAALTALEEALGVANVAAVALVPVDPDASNGCRKATWRTSSATRSTRWT